MNANRTSEMGKKREAQEILATNSADEYSSPNKCPKSASSVDVGTFMATTLFKYQPFGELNSCELGVFRF